MSSSHHELARVDMLMLQCSKRATVRLGVGCSGVWCEAGTLFRLGPDRISSPSPRSTSRTLYTLRARWRARPSMCSTVVPALTASTIFANKL